MSNETERKAFETWCAQEGIESKQFMSVIEPAFQAGAEWQRSLAQAENAELKAKAVPDGHALIPARIELSPEDIACIMLQCGGDEEATEIDEQFNGGVLWVGSLRDDDGSETYGLHIACVGYLEEGSTTIAEFEAAPAQQQPQAVIEQGKARIAELERQATMDGGLARLALNAAKDQLASAEAALDKAQALNVELRDQLKAKAAVPDRMTIPKPLWKDARHQLGDPLNAADIRGAEMFNLAIDEVLRLNSAAAPAQTQSDSVIVPRELLERVINKMNIVWQKTDEVTELRALLGGEA